MPKLKNSLYGVKIMKDSRNQKARTAILQALGSFDAPAGAARIAERLPSLGVPLQPRSIRLHLARLDEEGLTRLVSRRRGRILTESGRAELERGDAASKVGFVRSKVDTLCYRMTFQPGNATGTVIANFTLLETRDLSRAFSEIKPVLNRKLGMGDRLCLIPAGGKLAGRPVPTRHTALGTLCSVSLNGFLTATGIPVVSRYGGLLELRQGRPMRFVELLDYSGTTVDPLELFIRAGMTNVRSAARSGEGIITASFREIPSVAMEDARRLFAVLRKNGMGGVLLTGRPGQPLLDIPVGEGRSGLVVIGGLNPVAALVEAGIPCDVKSLCGLEPFAHLVPFEKALRSYMNDLRQ